MDQILGFKSLTALMEDELRRIQSRCERADRRLQEGNVGDLL